MAATLVLGSKLLLAVGSAIALSSCCTTRAVLRAADGREELASVRLAERTPSGALVIHLSWFPGTLGARSTRLELAAEELASAHATGELRVPSTRLHDPGGPGGAGEPRGRALGLETLPTGFDWQRQASELRLPAGADEALFHQARVLTWHGPVRFIHLEQVDGEVSTAVLWIEPRDRTGRRAWYAAVPLTASFDFFTQSLLFGFVLGFAGLGI